MTAMNSSEKIQVYTQSEYFEELIRTIDVSRENDRIAIMTMAFEADDPYTIRVLESLKAAVKRGAEAHLNVDAYAQIFDTNYLPTGDIASLMPWSKQGRHFKEKREELSLLSEAGIVVTETNSPSSVHIPYGGRSHIKGAVVNKNWWIGGCNLADTDNLDTMVGGYQEYTADFLYKTFRAIAECGSVRRALGDEDIVWPIDEETDLLIDVGRRGQSEIYDRMLRAADNADEWSILTCQFFPSGRTARKMANGIERGLDSHVFYNNPRKNGLGGNIMNIYRCVSQFTLPDELFRGELEVDQAFLHAKIFASDKEAIVGSHNLIEAGVTLGTAEIAIHSRSSRLAKKIAMMAYRLASKTDDTEFQLV